MTLQGDDLEFAQIALDGFLEALGIPGDSVPADPQARSRLFSAVIAQYAEAGKSVLVVIDNAVSAGQCELLIPAGGRAVITSRNELSILDARIVRLGILSDEAGAELLAGQLGVSLGADRRVADHKDDARTISGLCGGLPLALRIVAAILAEHPARSLATVAADLRDARTRLDELHWEGMGEKLAVRAAFDVSCHGLQPERARVFRLMAVNPGPEISTSAAAELADLSERAARHHLEGLARTHLIEPGTVDGRWRLHDLIRIYAAEEQPDGTDDAWVRLIAYYVRTANNATAELAPTTYRAAKRTFAGRAEALAWLDSEYPNLAAVALLATPEPMFADVALGLWRYFELRWRINDGIMLTEHALTMARELGDHRREARAQSNLAGLFRQARMFDAALTAGHEAVVGYRSVDDQEGLGIALNNLAGAQVAAGQFEQAIPTGRDAVAVFQILGDRHREGIALGHIAIALRATGQLAESIAAYHDVLAVMRESDDRRGEGATLVNLASALERADRLDEAISAGQQAVTIFAELGDRVSEGVALNNLAGFMRLNGDGSKAIPVLRAAIDAHTEGGDIHSRAAAVANLGNALAENGHLDDAITAFRNAVADYGETDDRSREGAAERSLGQVLLDAGQRDEAAEAFRAALEIFRKAGDRREEGMALTLLGRALPEAQREEATAAFEAAVAVFRELGESGLERAAMSGLLNLSSPVPAVAEMKAKIEAGLVDEIVPGVWIDVTVTGGQGDEQRRKSADEIRARIREAVAKVSTEQSGSPDSAGMPE